VTRSSALLRVFDRLVVPFVRRVESRFDPPFGQSLLAVGRVGDVASDARA
jgi:hypothetical protein